MLELDDFAIVKFANPPDRDDMANIIQAAVALGGPDTKTVFVSYQVSGDVLYGAAKLSITRFCPKRSHEVIPFKPEESLVLECLFKDKFHYLPEPRRARVEDLGLFTDFAVAWGGSSEFMRREYGED